MSTAHRVFKDFWGVKTNYRLIILPIQHQTTEINHGNMLKRRRK
jgi:hypothetical protein